MFRKSRLEAEYAEMSQKYLTCKAAYNNEKARADDFEKEVVALKSKLNELSQAGIASPDLVEQPDALNSGNTALKAKEGAASYPENEQLKAMLKSLSSRVAELAAALQNASKGERRMSENNNEITKWEYKQVGGGETELNKLGNEGWEAVGQRGMAVLMKRPKPQPKNEHDYGYSR